ncbi:hypothetical protein K474DRAFT_1712437 [Panus rudis PR-1116 ss-1]|nr:hypothetical protein K474DRAFT_1712437 [Panus rudis PR-1116 ss-1]
MAVGINVPSLSSLVLRDGSLQFITLLAINVANIIQSSFSGSASIVIALVGTVAQSLMMSHFFFNLRQVYLSTGRTNSSRTDTSVQFASVVVGNLGAPLDYGFYDESDDDDDTLGIEISDGASRSPTIPSLLA